ncbi:MAG: hypothetical protein L6Q78_12210 [Bacteroidia bacterium]|nr:hypothetical protein [Bacteroidia bacterium]
MSETKICLNCHNPIKGRADKKFCDDSCRSSHFHKQTQDELFLYKRIHSILRKNRRILMQLFSPDSSKGSVPKTELQEQGFHFDYHTQEIRKGKNCLYACYDYAYQEINEREVVLLKIR